MEENARPHRILLIDDQVALCQAMKPTLESRCNADVVTANTGDEALDILLSKENQDVPFSLVILDMQVPRAPKQKVDPTLGLTILIELQNYYQFLPLGTPIIVYTAHSTYDNCVSSIKAGAADYIYKDEDKAEEKLLQRINDLLNPPPENEDELRNWLRNNIENLIKQYHGRFIGVLDKEIAQKATQTNPNLKLDPELDGFALLTGKSREDVRKAMLEDRTLRWEKPCIVHIPTEEEYNNG